MTLRHVLTSIAIGPVTVPNRVVRTGHGTGLGGGTMSQALIDYHVARAKGGVGLTILEVIAVHGAAYPFLVAGAGGLVEGYRSLMAQVRPYGMKVFQQIGHPGNEALQADGSPPLSSSATVGALLGVQAEPMSRAQISGLVESYVAAARDCVAGELDGIELHMAHGYLIQQFLSPLHNFREDEYGGSFENRLRLPLELLSAVRGAIPSTMALGVRLSSELLPVGMEPADVARVARAFEERGLIDFVNLTIGTDYNPHKIIGAMHEPVGYELPYDEPVRKATRLPVLVSGRFRTLEEADQVICAGGTDLVALTRAHIADPDLVRKTREGRADEVRPCIGCNHGCIGGLLTAGRMGCTVNVAAGNEAALSEELIVPATSPRTVLVVGGGPAGLEAARVAALRGHRVILAEASSRLGGAVNVAKRAPRRMGIGDITDWLEREVYRLGVDVRLSTFIQSDDLPEFAPDAIIVATGSLPRLDGRQHLSPGLVVTGMEHRHVVSSHDLLMENREWGEHAVVFDDAGHYEAVAAAEYLIERGLAVTFVSTFAGFAPHLQASLSSEPALERLARGKFRLITYGRLFSVHAGHVCVGQRFGGSREDIPADVVVFISYNACNSELAGSLPDTGTRAVVGDARSPRYLQAAIREGHLAGRCA